MAQNDEPDVLALPKDAGYAVVSPAQIVPRRRRRCDDPRAGRHRLDQRPGTQRARAAATQIAAKASGGMSLADAMKGIGVAFPPARPISARRIQIAMAQGQVSPALKLLFSRGRGKSRMGADPQGGGFFVVRVNKITPGNALIAPA